MSSLFFWDCVVFILSYGINLLIINAYILWLHTSDLFLLIDSILSWTDMREYNDGVVYKDASSNFRSTSPSSFSECPNLTRLLALSTGKSCTLS